MWLSCVKNNGSTNMQKNIFCQNIWEEECYERNENPALQHTYVWCAPKNECQIIDAECGKNSFRVFKIYMKLGVLSVI